MSRATTRQGQFPPGEPFSEEALAALASGPADPNEAHFSGGRRANQQQVVGMARAMPTAEEMELAERIKRQFLAYLRPNSIAD